jgi:Cu+-exporting ATPase
MTSTMSAPAGSARPAAYAVDLRVDGMTCASCVARVEKRLNAIDGVQASVNLPLKSAHVEYQGDATPELLTERVLSAVAETGYRAQVTRPPTAHDDGSVAEDDRPHLRDLRRRLLVSVPFALPVVAVSMIGALHFSGWQRVLLLLALPVVGWGAWPFHRAAVANARHGASTMDTLVSLGILAATAASVAAAITGGHSYLEVAVTVSVFLLAGRYAEARATHSGAAALRALLDLGAKDVHLLVTAPDGTTSERLSPVSELRVGSLFVARPGEKLATDGVVVSGSSAVDTSLLTGEPVPEDVGPGDRVTGATIATSGRLVVRATAVGEQTRLAQISRLVVAAQNGKAPVQRLADRVSGVFVPVVLLLAALTLAGWLLVTGDTGRAFSAAVAVLVIACPCALGLATPTALLTGTGRGAQLGVLIRGPEVLERTRRVDTVVLDKTGTLTTGAMTVLGVHAVGGHGAEPLRLAGALEVHSAHPLATAVAEAARRAYDVLPEATAVRIEHGQGVSGEVEGQAVRVGAASWLAAGGAPLGGETADLVAKAEGDGRTAVVVAVDGMAQAVITIGDAVRPSSPDAVRRLRALGLRPLMLTGDNLGAARRVADEVGIAPSDVFAGLLPEDKLARIAGLQQEGRVVAMVGDGVNDAAALARADLGIAMGGGTDAAIEAGDITLVRSDLAAAADAIQLGQATLRTVRANLGWAFGYNVAAIPLAAAGLLTPMVAGAAMALSSVLVVGNSLRLRAWRPGP